MKLTHILLIIPIALLSCNTTDKKSEDKAETRTDVKEKTEIVFPKNQKLTKEQQIASAVQSAPEDARAEAKVYGYDAEGNFVTLREGSNNFVCIADNPGKDGFQIDCYHISLEPMMARGRELVAEGKSRDEKEKIRAEEAKSGKLKLPKSAAALQIYYGENAFFNTETNQVENGKYRYVVYVPYATEKTSGLPLKPNKSSHPWLMFPGSYKAHIMITPSE